MATRNIENWKNDWSLFFGYRLQLARLDFPFAIIALVIPDERLFGFLNMQGMTLCCCIFWDWNGYFLLGLLNKILKIQSKTYFVVEMPNYKLPLFKM
jgi:ferrous iron transport protein B